MSTSQETHERGPATPQAVDPDVTEDLQEAVELLSECLTTELTIIEGYDLALRHAMNPHVSQTLLELRGDHARRTDLLRNRIKGRRTIPGEDTGATDALAELVAASSADPLDGASMAELEELERRGVELYLNGVDLVEPSTRAFFEDVLIPAQKRTHDLCRSLSGGT